MQGSSGEDGSVLLGARSSARRLTIRFGCRSRGHAVRIGTTAGVSAMGHFLRARARWRRRVVGRAVLSRLRPWLLPWPPRCSGERRVSTGRSGSLSARARACSPGCGTRLPCTSRTGAAAPRASAARRARCVSSSATAGMSGMTYRLSMGTAITLSSGPAVSTSSIRRRSLESSALWRCRGRRPLGRLPRFVSARSPVAGFARRGREAEDRPRNASAPHMGSGRRSDLGGVSAARRRRRPDRLRPRR
jgi:hypothetical protein